MNRWACGKVPHVALVRWNCRVEFLGQGCPRLSCRCFTDSGVKREDLRCQNWAEKLSTYKANGTKRVPKLAKGPPKLPLVNRVEKGEKKERQGYWALIPFSPISIKIQSTKSSEKQSQKTLILVPKGCQNRPNMDAKTHQESIPKLVPNTNVGKHIKNTSGC